MGEKKTIVLWEHGIPAIGISGVWNWKPEWAADWRQRYRQVYVLFDDDGDLPRQAAQKLAKEAGGKVCSVNGKPDDVLTEGWVTTSRFIRQMEA